VQLSPGESRCHGILSSLHIWSGEFDQAEQAAQRAVELNPCNADGLFNRATVLMSRGRSQESLEWFERAKDINPLLHDTPILRAEGQGTEHHIALWSGREPKEVLKTPEATWPRQHLRSRAFASAT
jgi:tetratricopeptide (TPR) repeat protein